MLRISLILQVKLSDVRGWEVVEYVNLFGGGRYYGYGSCCCRWLWCRMWGVVKLLKNMRCDYEK